MFWIICRQGVQNTGSGLCFYKPTIGKMFGEFVDKVIEIALVVFVFIGLLLVKVGRCEK